MRKKMKVKAAQHSHELANEIYGLLNTYGFLEQLRLECIADVKKKDTYKQLKDRIKDYVTNKMSREDWTSGALHLDTLREQVVECGVLTLTVERIVDVVVSRKLLEVVKPLVTEIVKKYSSHLNGKNRSPEKSDGTFSPKADKKSLEETAKLVRKICQDTQQGSKKIFADDFVSSSLASVSFPKSPGSDDDDDDNFSLSVSSVNTCDLSSFNGDVSSDEDNDTVMNGKAKAEECDESMDDGLNSNHENSARERRERKQNPKYSSSLFQTSFPSFDHVDPPITPTKEKKETKPSTPDNKKKLSSLPERQIKTSSPEKVNKLQVTPTKKLVISSPKKGVISASSSSTSHNKHVTEEYIVTDKMTHTRNMKIKIFKKCKPMLEENNDLNSRKRKDALEDAQQALKVMKRAMVRKATIQDKSISEVRAPSKRNHQESMEVEEETLNDSVVRKSGRQRKLNSRIFDDYTHTVKTFNSFTVEDSQPKEKRTDTKVPMPLTASESPKLKKSAKEEIPIVYAVKSQVPPPPLSSRKRYDSSELYKPRPVIHSSGNRGKKM